VPKSDVPAGSKAWPRSLQLSNFDLKATVSDDFCSHVQVQSCSKVGSATCTALALPPDACSVPWLGLSGGVQNVSRDRATLSTCRNASGAAAGLCRISKLMLCRHCTKNKFICLRADNTMGTSSAQLPQYILLCVRISTTNRGGAVSCGSERPERLLPVLRRAARPVAGDLHAQVQFLSTKLARCTAESSQDI